MTTEPAVFGLRRSGSHVGASGYPLTGQWTHNEPSYSMALALAADRQYYGQLLGIEDDEQAIVDFIVAHPPQVYRG